MGYAENPWGWNPFTACGNITPSIQLLEQRQGKRSWSNIGKFFQRKRANFYGLLR